MKNLQSQIQDYQLWGVKFDKQQKWLFHRHINCVWGYFACFSTLIRLNWVEINFFLLIPGQAFFANFRGAPDVNL